MSIFSISGLSSGINTDAVIDQLMTVAAQPQAQLKTRLSAAQAMSNAYKAISRDLAAASTALTGLGATSRSVTSTAASGTTVFDTMAVTSTSTSVAASAGRGAVEGATMQFDVVSLARAQVTTVAVSNGTPVADPDAGLDVVRGDGTTVHVDLVDGTAEDVARALNDANAGVRALVVNTDNGPLLRLSGTATGSSGSFSIQGLSAPATQVGAAADARIQVGDPANGGYSVSSSTNTFTGVEPGVTFSVAALAQGVTLKVDRDDTAATAGVKAAIDAINTALGTIAGATAKGATLAGDGTVRPIAQALLAAVSGGTGTGSFSSYGIKLSAQGDLVFDEEAFAASLKNQPGQAAADVGSTLAQRLSDVIDRFTATTDGQLTSAVDGVARRQDSLQDEIDDWDSRLADQKSRLQQRFAAMETALNRLKGQGDYLTSVFDALDGTKKSS